MGGMAARMAKLETSQAIDTAAAAWAAREDKGPLTPEDSELLEAWLAGDPRRPGALLRARAVFLRSDAARALGTQFDPKAFAPVRAGSEAPETGRRRVLIMAGAAAACILLTGTIGNSLLAPEAHATELGELRLVPLKDGSSVMLNTLTRVQVRYDRDQRSMRLVQGEADFRIVSDPDREFVLSAGSARLKTTGASFRVRFIAGTPLDILVYQGRVDVVSQPVAMPASHVVGPNSQLTLPHTDENAAPVETAPRAIAPEVVTRELAWREGKLAFEGETLATAAVHFSRYSAMRIVIEDPVLAQETVAGLFAANDPAGFSRAVASAFDADVSVRPGKIILTRNYESD